MKGYEVEFIYKHDDFAGGVLRSAQRDPMQWSAILSKNRWYISLHSDLKTWDHTEVRGMVDSIQRQLQLRLVA